MRQAQWKAAVRGPATGPGPWYFKGNLAYTSPGWLLTGALADNSGFSTGVYVTRVVLPLFVPDDAINLTWSERVLGPSRIIAVDDELSMAEAVGRATAPFPGERELLMMIADRPVDARNWLPLEAAGYAAVLLGDNRRGLRLLDRVRREVPTMSYQAAIVERAELVAALVESGAHADARRQLGEWRDETVAALRLEARPWEALA